MKKKSESAEANQDEALIVLNAIRTETVLSKLPIHKLAKKGAFEINISQQNEAGQVSLRWKVSHDTDGAPGQLAYKIDTLVVNRRIDENREAARKEGQHRSLSKRLRLGSLTEIAKELGNTDSSKNRKDIREALLQNAGTTITAKLSYKAVDGSERWLDAKFSRYSVVFTGQRFPDGSHADAVYVILNEPYWEVLNSVPFRPLDYDYLKQLTPSAQRFYEIVSFKVFAALANGYPSAKLLYSEYCVYSAQMRYFDYDRFKKQMYKVHQPHLKSGYLAKVSYEEVKGGAEQDWLMVYTPGRKAEAEYRQFSRRNPQFVGATTGSDRSTQESDSGDVAQERNLSEAGRQFVDELTKKGISSSWARRHVGGLDQGGIEQARKVVEYWAAVGAEKKWTNPAGMLRRLLEIQASEGLAIPSLFSVEAERGQGSKRLTAEAERINEEARQFLEQQRSIESRIDSALEAMTQAQREQLYRESLSYCTNLPGFGTWTEAARTRQIDWEARKIVAKSLS
jgi:hypothetical protein